MNKISRYTLAQAFHGGELSKKVNDIISSGFTLYGDPFVLDFGPEPGGKEGNRFLFNQAMIKGGNDV